jgi:hypothetical protein
MIEDHGPSPPPSDTGSLELGGDRYDQIVSRQAVLGQPRRLVAGFVLTGITFALAISNDIFIMSGPDVTGVKSGVLSWTLLGLMGLAMLLLLFAAVTHFVAWIGAVLNTAQLPDKTWFVVLLVVGLLGLVFFATVAYVIAGPDGVKAKDETRALPQAGGAPQLGPPSTINGPSQQVGSSPAGHPGQFG